MKSEKEIKTLFLEMLRVYNEIEPSERNKMRIASLYAKMQTLIWIVPELEKELEKGTK